MRHSAVVFCHRQHSAGESRGEALARSARACVSAKERQIGTANSCDRHGGRPVLRCSVYRAAPRPMALEPGTVYEIERSGSPEGLFTVGAAQQIGNTWYGLGEWQPVSATQP